jgi:hypothetical protein
MRWSRDTATVGIPIARRAREHARSLHARHGAGRVGEGRQGRMMTQGEATTAQRHGTSNRRMGRASNHGGIPLERGSALHDPGP